MHLDRLLLRVIAASLPMLAVTVSAEAEAPVIGKPAVLSYVPLGASDSCGMRDGDALVTATHGRISWLDGRSGAIRRSVPLKGAWPPCAMATVGDAKSRKYAIAHRGVGNTTLVVTSKTGVVEVRASLPEASQDIVGMSAIDEHLFVAFQSPRTPLGTIHVLSARDLAVERSQRLGPIVALERRGDEAIAVLASGGAVVLHDVPEATTFEFPRISYERCGEGARRKPPVPLGNGTYVSFECKRDLRSGMLRVRQANGAIVAEREVRSIAHEGHAWFFTEESTVVPWDDGVRILANAEDSVTLSVLKVPISAIP